MNGLGIKQFVGHPLKNTPTALRYTCRQEPGSLTTEYTVRDSKRRSGVTMISVWISAGCNLKGGVKRLECTLVYTTERTAYSA